MSDFFQWVDEAPLLDLIYFGIPTAILLAVAVYLAHDVYETRQLKKKAKRLIELAGGEPPSVRSGRKPLSKTAAASTDSPYPGAASSPQGSFDADHGFNNTPRPRVGTRRGK